MYGISLHTDSLSQVCCPNGNGGGSGSGSPAANVLPPAGECGIGSSNRIYGGEETDLDEFPWNCLIEYSKREFI